MTPICVIAYDTYMTQDVFFLIDIISFLTYNVSCIIHICCITRQGEVIDANRGIKIE